MVKKILFLSNHFITLYSFRKEMIERMVNEGHEVYLSLPPSDENIYFEKLGCNIIPTNIDRRGINPFKDLGLIKTYKKIISKVKPDIIFSFTIKPNIYGTLVSNQTKYRHICNITGTGATFLKPSVISKICEILYKFSVKNCYKVFFQNSGDRDYFLNHNIITHQNYAMLPGSGCNIKDHPFHTLPEGDQLNFIYIGRVMKLKGIDEYLTSAEAIRKKYPHTKFYIAGWNEEPEYMKKVEEAEKAGWIEYIGFRKDIDKWIEKCHCTVLASHGGEGIPNVLLESAAMGRVCIASGINGNTDVVEDGVNGFIFEKGNAIDLINKIEKFILLSPEHKSKMGYAGHIKVVREFNREIVIQAYMDEVHHLL